MRPLLRPITLLTIALITLAACASPSSSASAPAVTPVTSAAAGKAAPDNRVELAAGRYQLLMFYSPL